MINLFPAAQTCPLFLSCNQYNDCHCLDKISRKPLQCKGRNPPPRNSALIFKYLILCLKEKKLLWLYSTLIWVRFSHILHFFAMWLKDAHTLSSSDADISTGRSKAVSHPCPTKKKTVPRDHGSYDHSVLDLRRS